MVALHGDWLFGGSKKDAAVEVWRQRLSAMTVPFVVLGGSGWFWVALGGSGWFLVSKKDAAVEALRQRHSGTR